MKRTEKLPLEEGSQSPKKVPKTSDNSSPHEQNTINEDQEGDSDSEPEAVESEL